MHIDPYIVLGSAIVGLLVGMTGAGGGALMTPMLILLFGVQPSTAISSDLVAAFVMRPMGAAVHLRAGTVNLRLVRWMVVGSVPAAFLGAYLLRGLGNAKSAQTHIDARRRARRARLILRIVLLGAGLSWLLIARPWRSWSTQSGDQDGSVSGSGAAASGLRGDHHPADPVEVSGHVD